MLECQFVLFCLMTFVDFYLRMFCLVFYLLFWDIPIYTFAYFGRSGDIIFTLVILVYFWVQWRYYIFFGYLGYLGCSGDIIFAMCILGFILGYCVGDAFGGAGRALNYRLQR